MYKQYQLLAATLTNVYFTGRLGTYKYYNMDQVVAQSLTLYKKIVHDDASKEGISFKPFAGGIDTKITKFNFDADDAGAE